MSQHTPNDPIRKPDAEPPDELSFGFRRVAAGQKAELVKQVFDRVAGRYDLMNDLMSAGIHRLWKRALIDRLDPRPGEALIDVAGGTGDIAFKALARARTRTDAGCHVTVCDINESMLQVGRNRAVDRTLVTGLDWVCGNAEALPFDNARFDAYTIAFGIRNVTHLDRALCEAYRVLKPGGRFLCLEFSSVVLPGLDRLYDLYSFNVIPRLGQWVTGDADSYQYLVESIRRFPGQRRFATMMEQAGFRQVSFRNMTGGVVALHCGWRI
ncbi:MAG: bifunctional demethylmenaquinone methyltransferase/2-methoxy-6-polyprenyl-1,4-benzoquinol methylase UbiE [Alphaproteobacteria bacterium]|nr:MAG: bifunctional demethylmenaquinone methyltransferase/2-methoxy-6-polyprenyl-1,4-benzoquinol methylase UbiE [Alphaproteobacteria bacterium]